MKETRVFAIVIVVTIGITGVYVHKNAILLHSTVFAVEICKLTITTKNATYMLKFTQAFIQLYIHTCKHIYVCTCMYMDDKRLKHKKLKA